MSRARFLTHHVYHESVWRSRTSISPVRRVGRRRIRPRYVRNAPVNLKRVVAVMTMRPLASEMRPLASEMRPLDSEMRPLASEMRPFAVEIRLLVL